MEIMVYARKGNNMNMKENYYIYQFKQLNIRKKSTEENDKQNIMLDIVLRHEYTLTGASQGTRV